VTTLLLPYLNLLFRIVTPEEAKWNHGCTVK